MWKVTTEPRKATTMNEKASLVRFARFNFVAGSFNVVPQSDNVEEKSFMRVEKS